MRNRQEIIQYLGLEMAEEYVGEESIDANKKYIKAAQRIEQDFYKELAEETHGYGLHCDFVAMPSLLENEGDYPILVEVANYDGVVVYQRAKITLHRLFTANQTYVLEIPIDEKHHIFVEGLSEYGETNTDKEFNADNIKTFCIELIDNEGEYVKTLDNVGITLDTTIEELKERI